MNPIDVLKKCWPGEGPRCTKCMRKMTDYGGRPAKYLTEGMLLADGTISGWVCSSCAAVQSERDGTE